MTDVVIVGNGVAGHACARRLVRNGLKPLLVGPGLPYDRPPLTKAALAAGVARPYGDAVTLAERGIELLDDTVESIDFAARRLRLGGGGEVDATTIVLAVGLQYVPPPVPGLVDAYVSATPEGVARLGLRLADGPRQVLVIGAGLIGVETAATLATAGHEVTVVDMTPRPFDRLHDPLPAIAASVLEDVGARFVGDVRISAAELGPERAAVETQDHGILEADLVVAATGGRPAPLPGLPDGPFPLEVDAAMRVAGLDAVYAIGDCASPPHARFGRLRFPHWDNAIGTADRAADAIAGIEGVYERLPYWWSDIGPLKVAEFGVAAAVVEWQDDAGLHVGRDADGRPVCAMVVGDPARLAEGRALILS